MFSWKNRLKKQFAVAKRRRMPQSRAPVPIDLLLSMIEFLQIVVRAAFLCSLWGFKRPDACGTVNLGFSFRPKD